MRKVSNKVVVSRLDIFDLEGVILQYGKKRLIPLMDKLLDHLAGSGCRTIILSSHSKEDCARRLQGSGYDPGAGVEIMSSEGSDKGAVVADLLRESGCASCMFVDDKPANLESVLRKCGDKVRVIGFLGSRRYARTLSAWCLSNRVELALSSVDLGKVLNYEPEVHLGAAAAWSDKELAELLPGLEHPASSMGGDTDRAILAVLQEREVIQDYESVYTNACWIACGECLWKVFSEFVARSLGHDDRILGYSAGAHTSSLKELYDKSSDPAAFRSAFGSAFSRMMAGIREIGVDAENCRLKNLPMDKNRIKFVREQLREVFGPDWEEKLTAI